MLFLADCVYQSLGFCPLPQLISGLFRPAHDNIPIIRKYSVSITSLLVQILKSGDSEKKLQIMTVTFVYALFIGEFVPNRCLRDDCLQSTLDGIACQIVGPAEALLFKQRPRFQQASFGESLQVASIHR